MLVHERVKFIKFDDIELSSHGYYQGYSVCEFETKNGPKIIKSKIPTMLQKPDQNILETSAIVEYDTDDIEKYQIVEFYNHSKIYLTIVFTIVFTIILIVLLWIITTRYGHSIGTVNNPYPGPTNI